MNIYSFKANKETISKINDYFKNQIFFSDLSKYIAAQYKYDGMTLTIYTSDKVVIAGDTAEKYYNLFNGEQTSRDIILPQAGSDEVGTGDYFGPICVCASYIDESIYQKIKKYNLDDSKKLTDTYILKVIPEIIDLVPHSLLILDNAKYNKVIQNDNMNSIKAKMHNQAYLNLINKGIKLPKLVVIDDFCGESLYYKYLSQNDNVIKSITFETKAESKYISVGLSSMICRYAFLQYMDQLSKKYDITFPKGAGNIVDEFGKEFINLYGDKELNKVAKLNFKNTTKIHQ